LREQGRNEEARQQLARALILAGSSPVEQIDSLLGMAELDRETMRWNESFAAWNKVMELARRQNDVNGEALALRGLGLTHLNRGDLSQAEPLLRRSLWLFENKKDSPPQQIANALQCVATIHYERKKYALAEDALMRGLDLLKNTLGEEHPHTARLMEQLAEVLGREKRYADARRYADHAYSVMRSKFGEESFSAAEARGTIGLVKQESHDLSGAAGDYEAAIRSFRGTEAADGQGLVILMDRYASLLNALHRKREARQLEAEIRSFHAR
jgi:tetratricopeptide (TPR) repeat protein